MKWRAKKESPPVRVRLGHPLDAVPMLPPRLETRRDSRGVMHLRLPHEVKGMKKRVAAWLGYDYSRKVELDEYGTLYYSLVDGRRTLRAIAESIRSRRGGSAEETGKHVVLFTKSLMQRNMILLKVPQEPA